MERRKRAAMEAIDNVFSDTTVTQEETLETLEEIEADVESKIAALRDDIANKKES